MALSKLLIPVFTFFIACHSWAGNGSSGVGTASIVPGFGAKNFKGSIENVDNVIIDKKTNEKIVKIIKVNKDSIDFKKLAPAKFGETHGHEFIPNKYGEDNYWVLCKKGEVECYKLIPLSKDNKKIPSMLGSLVEEL